MTAARLLPGWCALACAALLACASAWGQTIAFQGAASASVSAWPVSPAFQAAGTAASGTGGVSPAWPAHAAGDVALLFIESTGGEAANLSTAAGFAAVANSPQSTGTGTNGTRLTVYWARATSASMPAPTVQDPGNHLYAQIITYRGVVAAGDPWDATAGGVKASASTSVSVTGVTTSVPNTLVVQAAARDNDSAAAAFSAQANGSLSGIAERSDAGTSSGNGGGFAVWDGVKATAGATGNTTATVTSSVNAFLTIALLPESNELTINVPAGTVSGDVMVAAVAVTTATATIATPAGWTLRNTVVQSSANASRQAIYTRVAGGAEPASYTWTFSGAHTGAAGGIVSYSGVDPTTPVDVFSGNTTPIGGDSTVQHRATGVTTTSADAMVVTAHSYSSSGTWTPTAMTERVDVNSGGGTGGIALAMNEVAQANAGPTGNKLATASANGDAGAAHIVVLRPDAQGPVLEWALDETAWSGAAGEVLDTSGNGLHGRAVNGTVTAVATPAIPGSPGTCRYGAFDGANDYVEVADHALLDITDELTVMMWLRPTSVPGGAFGSTGTLRSFMSKDNNYEAHLAGGGAIYWWWGGGAQQLISAGAVAANTWTHVALVYSRAGGFQRIYLNGVQDANTNNQTAALATNNNPFQIGGDQGFAGREYAGQVDEVRVFRQALGPGRIQQYMNATRPCQAVNHYAISHAGSGVACDTHQITITAHDAAHTAVDAGAATVNLATSNGRGTWTGIAAGGGSLSGVGVGAGTATYQFAPGSNSVTLNFRYADLAAASETFGFNVAGGGFSETTGTASGTDDPSFTMAQAGFRFRNVTDNNTTIPVQLSGKPSSTGFNAKTIRLQAIRTDTATGACTGLFASQTRGVDLGAECNSPAACAGRQVSVNAGNIATSNDNGGAGAAAYTSVSLAFNASSEADTVIAYPDAGQVSLHARYDLDTGVAGFEAIGASNAFIVRPFGLAMPGINHSSTATGTLIGAAGDAFTMTVQAYQWAAGEDANNDGVPDAGANITNNGTVPNFAATATVGVSANLPGTALGAVARGAGCAGAATVALAGGTGSGADWCYSEAGNALLTASVSNYLAAGVNVTGSSAYDGVAGGGYVGRFRPKHFAVMGTPTLAHRTDLACGASNFTYLGEQLSLGFTLQARNAQNAVTQNYTGAYARLNLATAASLGLGARAGATNLTARIDSALAPTGSFASGVASLTVPTAVRRNAPDNPDGPFAATQFGIAPVDADGVAMGTLNQDVDGVGGNDHFAVGPVAELRFGRLRIANAYGPVTQALAIPLQVQHWNGSAFVVNAADSCTTLARDNIALAFSGVIAACNTQVQQASLAFAAGAATLTLAAPGAGRTGTVLLTPQLGTAAGTYCPGPAATTAAPLSYLLGRWNDASNPDGNAATSYDDKPSGQAGFGLYGSQPQNFIFQRENF